MELQANRPHRIGAIEVTPLWDGPLASALDKIIDPAHAREAEQLLAMAPPDALTMNVYGFLLKQGDRLALIDTGAGRLFGADLGKLPQSLAAAGGSPERIERIFITHIARDHYGGLATDANAAAFPNAELVLHEKEAAFWLDGNVADMPQRARRHVEDARQFFSLYAGRVRRVKDNETIDGVTARLAPGHTPGHTCWHVQSEGQSLLSWGDLIHIAYIHLPAPHIAMEYDLDPVLALESRLRMLDWVASARIPVAGAHLPTPGIGAIVRSGAGYAFEPDR